MERVCVQIKKNSLTAFIKEISGNTAIIELEDNTTMTVGANELTMVDPKEHDSVLVIGGVDVGFEGELACIDGSDAILKDANEDFKIVDYVHLAKIIADA
jgi:transcription elongation factor SPT5